MSAFKTNRWEGKTKITHEDILSCKTSEEWRDAMVVDRKNVMEMYAGLYDNLDRLLDELDFDMKHLDFDSFPMLKHLEEEHDKETSPYYKNYPEQRKEELKKRVKVEDYCHRHFSSEDFMFFDQDMQWTATYDATIFVVLDQIQNSCYGEEFKPVSDHVADVMTHRPHDCEKMECKKFWAHGKKYCGFTPLKASTDIIEKWIKIPKGESLAKYMIHTLGIGQVLFTQDVQEVIDGVMGYFKDLSKRLAEKKAEFAFEPKLIGSMIEETRCGWPDEFDVLLEFTNIEEIKDDIIRRLNSKRPSLSTVHKVYSFRHPFYAAMLTAMQDNEFGKRHNLIYDEHEYNKSGFLFITYRWRRPSTPRRRYDFLRIKFDIIPGVRLDEMWTFSTKKDPLGNLLEDEETGRKPTIHAIFPSKRSHIDAITSHCWEEHLFFMDAPIEIKYALVLAKALVYGLVAGGCPIPTYRLKNDLLHAVNRHYTELKEWTDDKYIIATALAVCVGRFACHNSSDPVYYSEEDGKFINAIEYVGYDYLGTCVVMNDLLNQHMHVTPGWQKDPYKGQELVMPYKQLITREMIEQGLVPGRAPGLFLGHPGFPSEYEEMFDSDSEDSESGSDEEENELKKQFKIIREKYKEKMGSK